MDLSHSLSVLRRRWLVLLAFVLAGAGLGAARYASTPPTYESTTTVFFALTRSQTVGELAQGSAYLQALVQSYAEVTTSPLVLTPVIDQLQLDQSPNQLARRIQAKSRPNTALMDIRVSGRSPEQTAATANAVGTELQRAVANLSPRSSSRVAAVTVTTVTPASAPARPSAPSLPINLGGGIFLGLALGAAVVAVREAIASPVTSREAAVEATAAPVLTLISRRRRRRHPLSVVADPWSPQAEAFYMLRTNLQSGYPADRPLRIVVASARPGEGRTTTAVNLAMAVSHTARQVLLVDADLRRPSVSRLLGMDSAVGLSTVLVGAAGVEEAICSWMASGEQTTRLSVLPAGPLPANPSELLASEAMDKLLDLMTLRYDVVVIDTSPLLVATDAAVLASRVEGTLLVVDSRRTSRRHLSEAVTRLQLAGGAIIGVVLNRTRPERVGLGARLWSRRGTPRRAAGRSDPSHGG
jgi:capsular exopolysaccharide synthesis family protein